MSTDIRYNGSGKRDDTAFMAISNVIRNEKRERKRMAQMEKLYEKNRKIIEHYGLEEQLVQLSEECSELSQAAAKLRRTIKGDLDKSAEGKRKADLKMEITDVLILMDQIIPVIGLEKDEVLAMASFKIDRQLVRIKKQENG